MTKINKKREKYAKRKANRIIRQFPKMLSREIAAEIDKEIIERIMRIQTGEDLVAFVNRLPPTYTPEEEYDAVDNFVNGRDMWFVRAGER